MRRGFSSVLPLISLLSFATQVSAADAKALSFSFKAEFGYTKQEYEEADTDIWTINLEPRWKKGPWEASLTLPWQRIDGKYHATSTNTSLATFCSNVKTYPRFFQKQIALGTVSPELVAKCFVDQRDENTIVGEGDVVAQLSYNYTIPKSKEWEIEGRLEHKFQNGDEDKGLGSGTSDTRAAMILYGEWEKLNFKLESGYTYVSPGNEEGGIEYKDFEDYLLDLSWQVNVDVTVGVERSHVGEFTNYSENVESAVVYGDVDLSKAYSARVFVSDYLDTPYYPDNEYGVSLNYYY